jgi:anti-sigma regulatory factor (Ser/Thr protein kinase)
MAASVKNAHSAMFLAQRGELRRIGAFLQGFCAESGLARERCLRLNLVLEELFVNTVRHGHRGDCEAPVWITLDAQPEAVQVIYEDIAPAFNPYAHLPEKNPGKIGGLGVLLTRELAATRDYAYLFGRNRIRLSLLR